MEKVQWTDASDEVIKFIQDNNEIIGKVITDYNEKENRKIWSFFGSEKDKQPIAVFEQFFDINFFKDTL